MPKKRDANSRAADNAPTRSGRPPRGGQTLPRRTAAPQGAGGAAAPVGAPLVAVVMGSTSDWETMRHADEALSELGVPHECRVVSAHRTPELMRDFAHNAAARGIEVIVAGAGGAAHLPGMIAAQTVVPVLGVPVESRALSGMDSLLSIVQMPAGVPVGTLAIGRAGARNAGLLAAAILATRRPKLRARLEEMRAAEERRVRESTLPTDSAS
jgi:5-(carboxyamino)imidazole ribonucleotide mutase